VDLVDECLVGPRQLDKLLLQRLNLLLLGVHSLLEQVEGLIRRELILVGLDLSLRRGFPPNVVQVILPVGAEG
jgi:hypothetical protein